MFKFTGLIKEAKKKGERTYDEHEYPGAGRIGKYTGVTSGAQIGAGAGVAMAATSRGTVEGPWTYKKGPFTKLFKKKMGYGKKMLAGGIAGAIGGGWLGGSIGERIFGGPRLDKEAEARNDFNDNFVQGMNNQKIQNTHRASVKAKVNQILTGKPSTWAADKGKSRDVRHIVNTNKYYKTVKTQYNKNPQGGTDAAVAHAEKVVPPVMEKRNWFKGAKSSPTHLYHPGTSTGQKIRKEFTDLKIKISPNNPIVTDTTRHGGGNMNVVHRSVNPKGGNTQILTKKIRRSNSGFRVDTNAGTQTGNAKTLSHIANRRNNKSLIKHDIK